VANARAAIDRSLGSEDVVQLPPLLTNFRCASVPSGRIEVHLIATKDSGTSFSLSDEQAKIFKDMLVEIVVSLKDLPVLIEKLFHDPNNSQASSVFA